MKKGARPATRPVKSAMQQTAVDADRNAVARPSRLRAEPTINALIYASAARRCNEIRRSSTPFDRFKTRESPRIPGDEFLKSGMDTSSAVGRRSGGKKTIASMRLGCVSFLNARPLIAGLDEDPDVTLELEVPSRLLDGLIEHRFETALLPVIDYQRLDDLRVVPAGGIGSDGKTLTVRIFSRCPIADIRVLACDPDSHTSVALARILLGEKTGRTPALIELHDAPDNAYDAMLLIGDKVVCDAPVGYSHDLDLGEAWKEMTGLPFVFAVWMTRLTGDVSNLDRTLDAARQRGLSDIDTIVADHARPRGWPEALARKYLTQHLTYSIGPRELDAIRKFHQLAFEHGILSERPRALVVAGDPR
jgi:chorismate dehydratase